MSLLHVILRINNFMDFDLLGTHLVWLPVQLPDLHILFELPFNTNPLLHLKVATSPLIQTLPLAGAGNFEQPTTNYTRINALIINHIATFPAVR